MIANPLVTLYLELCVGFQNTQGPGLTQVLAGALDYRWERDDELGAIVLDYARSQQSAKHNQRNREKGGGLRSQPKGLLGWLVLCWGLCPTETDRTMELRYKLTWHSECGAETESLHDGSK